MVILPSCLFHIGNTQREQDLLNLPPPLLGSSMQTVRERIKRSDFWLILFCNSTKPSDNYRDMMTCTEIHISSQWPKHLPKISKDEVLLFQSGFSQPLPAENAAGTGDGFTKFNKSQNKSGDLPGRACASSTRDYIRLCAITYYYMILHDVKFDEPCAKAHQPSDGNIRGLAGTARLTTCAGIRISCLLTLG